MTTESRTAAATRADYWIDRALAGCVPSAARVLLDASYIDEAPSEGLRDQWRECAAERTEMHDALVAEVKRLRTRAAEWDRPVEIRRNDDGTLDEVFASGHVHVEQMTDRAWWMAVTRDDGTRVVLWFTAARKVVATVTVEAAR